MLSNSHVVAQTPTVTLDSSCFTFCTSSPIREVPWFQTPESVLLSLSKRTSLLSLILCAWVQLFSCPCFTYTTHCQHQRQVVICPIFHSYISQLTYYIPKIQTVDFFQVMALVITCVTWLTWCRIHLASCFINHKISHLYMPLISQAASFLLLLL